MAKFPEITHPNGQILVLDEASGGYFPRGTSSETLLKAMEAAQLKGLHTLAVKRLRQFLNFCFWGLVLFIAKVLISVADHFDNYGARPVAEGVGNVLGIAFSIALLVLLAIGVIGFISTAGIDFSRASKGVGKMPKIPPPGIGEKPNKGKRSKPIKPLYSDAQQVLANKK